MTSGAYGHHLGCAVGLAMLVEPELAATAVTVEIAGRRVEAELSRRPFYDPDNVRLRA
ncbi:MAG TPA: glycine cleavage T C-terminal barrel domain-containing protein [Solirubrobacteraceae bacterium]|nr:glycine cleavage T C-terminal barrel domain-containing protein [Solirubrobacteraceae bacterium]